MSTRGLVWRLVRARPGLALLNVTLAVMIALIDLAPGPITRAFFDRLGGQAGVGLSAEALIVALLGIALVRTVTKTNAVLADVLHEFTIGVLLRRNLLEGILARPGNGGPPGVAQNSPGEDLSRFRDDAAQAAQFVGLLCYGVSATLFTVGALALTFRIDPRLTTLVFLPLVATVAIAQRAFGRIERYRRASREATGRVTGTLGEMFEAVQAVQVAGAEAHLIAHLHRLNEERRRLTLRDTVLTRGLNAVFANTVSLGTGLVLLFAAGAMRAGTFTVGDFALFVYYLGWIGVFTRFFGGTLAGYKQAGVSFERMVLALRGAPPEALVAPRGAGILRVPTDPLPEPGRIAKGAGDRLLTLEVSGLSYRHPDSTHGIVGIDLHLERGSFTVVTGRVGAGKTTLLRVLLGLLPADGGEIRWNGERVADRAAWLVPPRVAYTPQVPRLFSETLRDNILLGLSEAEVDLPGAIRGAVLEHDLQHLADGLDTVVGPRGVKLSGGQVQRAAAARMLVRDAELLVIDDLSSALDLETERRLWERLRHTGERVPGARRRGVTCLVVSHRRAALRSAAQVVVLKGGRVEAAGTLEELLASCEEMRRLWRGDLGAMDERE